ncbi:MAG: cytochrome C biogenesis protein [Desulfobacteraceae bacterium 4572_123]|nr:MAG: cytochrome C biogenesis protein [Desulfobacteraceae bacterium 4572_123]
MFTETVHFPAAFIAGLLSFFSPCVLPLIPAYFTFISGFSMEELTSDCNAETRRKVFLATLSFVSGFSSVFILMGGSASLIGSFIIKYKDIIRIAGGILIIILGIHLTGLFHIRKLDFEKRIHLNKKPLHFFGTFLIGMAFAAGWSPCIGPMLGSILIIAGSNESVLRGIALLAVYSAGLAIPFIILSGFINMLLIFLKKATRVLKYINYVSGSFLIVIGLLLLINRLSF